MPCFFDTNVLVYAFGKDEKAAIAQNLLNAGGHIAVQSLNEFTRVKIGKHRWPWSDVHDALAGIITLCPLPVTMDFALHRRGIDLAKRYKFHVFDAMIVAAAITADCDTLHSEDMHHGLVVDGQLRIVNPFTAG
ncbi:PIN domain-containing protein [uncultured Sphingomonas sp.]|uniref:PIN domain-containing protein n=1 Tax=uncultured Sphingomonas sp. TaxID=158754 RepID=UPI0035CAC119